MYNNVSAVHYITYYTGSSPKHLTTPPPTAAANDLSSYNPASLATPTQLLTATNCKYKLLWLVDDVHVVQRVLSDLKQPPLSPACFIKATITLYRLVRATITLYPIGDCIV